MGTLMLVSVTEPMLRALLAVAMAEADADEVTPPLTPGNSWTPERIAWFEDYHRGCREGLDGPLREANWAIIASGLPVGAVRLKLVGSRDRAETGIWLARSARRRGLGELAMDAVAAEARRSGISTLTAQTAAGNAPALALLRRSGFEIRGEAPGPGVLAVRILAEEP